MSLQRTHSSRLVLVADHDPSVRQFLTATLKTEGYTVVAVNDGREAYRRLVSDADFEFAVLDLMMPHLKGLEIVRYMRTEKRLMKIPVVMTTSGADLSMMAECLPAGVSALLTKPFAPTQLQDTLRLFLNTRKSNS